MKRRSFLELLVACSGLPLLAPLDVLASPASAPLKADGTVDIDALCSSIPLRHYSLWDTVFVRPGVITDESLFLPPVPEQLFWIRSLFVDLNATISAQDAAEVSKNVHLDWRVDGTRVLCAPLWHLPLEATLPARIAVGFGTEWSMRLISSNMNELSAAVPVSVLMRGIMEKP